MSKAPLTPLEQVLSQTAPVEIPEVQTGSGEYGQRQPSVDGQKTYSAPADMLPLFEQAANKYQVPVNVLLALADQESSFNPRAVGQQTKWGQAKGLMQYLDTTAQRLGINPYDPAQSVEAAAMQLRERLDKGYAMEDAVKEHFAGPDRRQWGPKTARYGLEVIGKANSYADYYESLYAQQAQPAEAPAEQSAGDRLMEAATQDQFKAAQQAASTPNPITPLTIQNQKRVQDSVAGISMLPVDEQRRIKAAERDGERAAADRAKNQPQMSAWEPTLWDKIKGIGGPDRDAAFVEMTMRETAKREDISVDEAYRRAGGARPMFNPEGRPLIQATVEAAQVLGPQIKDVLPAAANTAMRAMRNGDVDMDENWLDKGINATASEQEEGWQDPNYDGFRGVGESLGFSLVNMAASAIAAAGGTAAAGPVGGAAAGLGTSGGIAYRASKDQFLDRVRANYENIHGEPPSQEEWSRMQKDADAAATKYGAFEAIPEAISTMIFVRALSRPLAGASRAGRLGDALNRIGQSQASEQLTETITGVGQNRAELEAGLTKEELSAADVFRKQALNVALTTGLMGGAGMAGRAAYDATPYAKRRAEAADVEREINGSIDSWNGDLSGQDGATPAAEQAQTTPAAQSQTTPTAETPAQIQPAPVGPPKPLMVDQVKPAPSGPLGRAMQNAMQGRADESAADTQRVTLSAEGLDPIGGVVISESAEAVTIRGDDGQKYEIPRDDIASGLAMIQPEGMEQAAPAEQSAEIEQQPVADQIEQVPAIVEQPAEPVAEVVQDSVNPPKRDDEEKKAQSYDEMDEPQLRDRLKYLAGQAKAAGGWNKTLKQERAKVEKAISKIVSQPDAKKDAEWAKEMADAAPTFEEKAQFFDRQQDIEAKQKSADQATVSPETVTAPAPAEASNQMAVKDEKAAVEPSAPAPAAADQTAVKWFGSEAKALGYIQGKGIGDTHEVVLEGKRYEIREKADPEGWEAVPGFAYRSRKEVMEAVADMRKYNEGLEFRTRTVDGKLLIEKRQAVVSQQLTTDPAAEESSTVAPTNRTQAAEAGAKAFAAGEKRVPPAMKPGLQEAWLKAWDKANLAAPTVAETQTPAANTETPQSVTMSKWPGVQSSTIEAPTAEQPAPTPAPAEKIPAPAWWENSTPAERHFRMRASGVKGTAQTPWNRLNAADQRALNEQWGDRADQHAAEQKPTATKKVSLMRGDWVSYPVDADGNRATGEIIEVRGKNLLIVTDDGARITIPRQGAEYVSKVTGGSKPVTTKKVSEGVTATVIDPSAGREATPAMKWVQSSTEERKETLKAAGYTDGDQARAYAGSEWADLPSTVREKIEGKQPEQSAMRQTVPIEDGRKVQKLRDMRELGRKAGEAGEERTAPEWSANSDLEDAWLEGYGQGMATRVQRAINASQVTPDLSDMTEPSITRRANPGNMSDRSFVARAFLVDGDVPVMGVGETGAEALAELRKDADRKKAEAKPAESDLDAMFDDVLAEVTGDQQGQPDKPESAPAATPADDAAVESLEDELRAQKKRVARLKGGDATKLKAAETRLRRMRTGIFEAEDNLIPAAKAGDAAALAKLEEMGFADTADAIRAFLPKAERTAGQSIASAAKNAGSALDEAINGLGALFGGNGKLSSGLTFDEETYAKAKPLFISAVANLRAASQDLRQAMQAVVKMVVDRFGADTAKNMKPYVVRFIEDVRDGRVELGAQDDAGRNAASDDQPLADVPPLGSYEAGQGTAETSEGLRAADAEGNGQLEDDRAGRGNSLDGSQEPVLSGATPEAGRVAEGPLNRREDVPNKLAGENPGNFVITEDFGLGQGTAGQKINANLEAIRTLRKVQAEGRFPTREEQSVMARYVGWGGLKSVFDVKKADATDVYGRAQRELKELLSADEYSAAFDSVRNAHYTAKGVVDAMWRMARHMGFDGGRVLEPTVGIGNFIGLQPADLAASSEWHASELDSVTGHMAKMLYPEANVLAATGFQAAPFADNVFDLAIGNPPFGAAQIVDRSPARKHLNRMKVHNYIIAKTGMHLRPGGVMAMVVTHRFLDTANPEARDVLAKDFKFLGAIRLPNDAFAENANTEVTTDIVFLQKLREGEKQEADPAWLDVAGSIEVDGETIGVNRYFQEHPNHILGRSAMDGTMYAGRRDAEGKGEYTVHSDGRDLGQAIDDLIAGDFADLAGIMAQTKQDANVAAVAMLQQSDIPVGGMRLSEDGKILRRDMDDEAGNAVVEEITADSLWKDQAAEYMAVRDAMVELRDASQQRKLIPEDFNELLEMARFAYKADGTPKSSPTKAEQAIYDMVDAAQKPEAFEWTYGDQLRSINEALARKQLGQESYDALKGMLDLRNRTLDLIHAEMADAKDMEAKRADLNKAYDAFVKKHGFVSDPSNANLLGGDIGAEAGLEASFEPAISKAVSKSTGVPAREASAKKSDILSKRVNFPDKEITSAESPGDALDISLSERGKVDLAYMAKLLGQDVKSVIDELTSGENPRLFVDPESGDYVDADEYLSGNVKHKLQEAKRSGLKANIKALEQVQPAPKKKSQIKPSIRGMWMPETAFTDFLRAIGVRSPSIMAIPGQGILRAEGAVGELTEFGAQFKHADRSVIDMFNAAASGKSITIMRRMTNGESYKDEVATKEVNALVERMSKVFNDFAYADDARAESIVEAFNEKMNTHAPRKYDGKKYMRLVGANPSIVPRRTQLDAAWRMIQSMTMLADHVVGAGKTFTAIMGVKERRRLGLSRKPMIAVPNHLVVQWARDFYKMYPGAKVLAATPADFAKKNRRRLFARIATGDYDAVIVGHTSLGFIENLQDDQKAIIDENIRSLEEAMEQAREAKESGRTLTQMRDRLEKYKDKLQALGERSVDEIGIDFKKLGIDYLVVDEAHEFKNLEYATSGERVVGMNDPSGSKRAFDLYVKVRGLLSRKGGVAFLTGTPVSNSLVELYTMMRYLAHDELKLRDQDHFDAWSGAYAATETKLEYTATQKLKPRRVLAGLNNLSALNQLYKQFADTITMTDLKRIYAEEVAERNAAKGTNDRTDFPIPKVKGGKRQLDTGEITEAQREYMDYLVARMGIIESTKGQEGRDYARIDNPLNVLTDARKMSLDIRVVDPTLPRDENGKVMRAARRITSIYNKWADVRGTQMVFCDLSTPAKNAAKDAKALIKDAAEKLFGESQAKQVRRQLDGKTYQQQWAWLKEKAEELIDNPELSQEKRDEIESYMAEQEDADAVVLTADIGFSVYDDLKAVLVEQGIPESEIAFIHDYNTPEQKEKLFDRMNNGYVRVLIGSSPKMGAGTNAQKRLVALHHMDAPWRPSDVEQREGRIIRQGNLFYQAIDEKRDGDLPPDILAAAERLRKENPNGFEVDITAYSTAGTSDTVMWQVLERKSAGIEQFRTGDLDEMQEGASDSNQYAEFMATSTGNPVFRLKLEAERAYTELEAEVGGKRIAKANADVFLRDFDGRRKDHQDMVDGLSAATVSEASYKGESGTAAEFEKAMGAAQAEYDAKYAEYLTKRGEAEAAIDAWEKQPEQSRGKKPAMPTAPTRPSILTKEVQASSGYARAAAALLDAGKVDGRVTMSIGDGASLFITGRKSFDGKTNYWDLYLEAANGQYIKIADGSGATARASTSIVRALEPSAIKQARDNEIANAKSRVANLESRKHAQEKLATLEIDESKVSEAKSLMDWYKMQVSFAEVQADIDRSARPNRFIPRDYRRFGASQERKKVAAAAPETITFEGVDYNTTGISVGHFAGRYLQAARASDGKPVFIYQLVTDKGAYETRQVVEQPKSAAEVKASIGERFSSQSKATADSVTRAITSGRAGRLVKQLLDAGKIVVHDRMDTVPGETVAGMMAKTEEDGTIHMVAENLSNRGATAVLLHEMFHAGARPLVGTRKWAQIMVRLERLYKQYQASQGKAGDFFRASQKRVESARQRMEAAGKPISDLLQVEEFGAYAIEEYERAPLTMRKLIDDMLGAIKDFLFRRFGMQLGQVTPAQLGAMARAALRSQAPRPGPNGGNRYSVQTDLDRALAMTEDDYIAAVNPTGETSDEDGSARLVRGDLTDPESATVVRKLADGITIERDAEGNFYARQGGDTIGEIINYGDEVNVNVLPETRGKGVAVALGMEFMRVNPFFQAGSLTPGGEAVVRAAWRRLKAEQGERYSLSEIPNDAPTDKQVDSWFSQKLTDAMTGPDSKGAASILAAAPMDRIVEELATNSPAAQEFLKLNRDMAAYRNKKYIEYDETAQKWMKLNWRNRKAAAEMADIMHEATIAQTDPAAPFESSITKVDTQLAAYQPDTEAGEAAIARIAADRKRREAHAALKARYDALPKAYRDLYVTVRDEYKGMAQELDEILAANLGMALDIGARKAERRYEKDMEVIRDEGLTGEERKEAEALALKRFNAATTKQRWNKRARMTELRQQLEANRLKGPYFPLARFGEYFVTVRDKDTGEVISFNLFKTSREQQQFAKEARSEGQVTTGLLSNKDEVRGAVDPRFVTEVEEILAGADVPDGVKDQVWQRYLESMPELSMRKGFIHRKGRKGFSSDALRAFASRMFHGSYQMGRLKYGAQMQEQLELAQEQASKSETPERDTAVINELNRRFKFVMNPTGTALAQRLTSAAFVWQLSMSPAAALVNLSQTVIMGMPILSADLNVNMAKTGAELTKALKDYGTGLGHAAKSKALTDDERAAMKAGYDTGLIEATQTYDLAGVGDTGVEYNPIRNKVMGAVGWMFHQTERLNREVTYLAAYRMARQKGQDHERAIETAARLTYKTHFDYSAANRPRVMQNDFAKVALVFRNYSVNMLFRLFRDIHQVVAGDRRARSMAIKQLAGITGMMAASAGVRGVWMYGIAMVLAGMLFGDDAEEKFKKGTIELLGPTMAGYVLNGLPGHALDASLSERIGMPDLWFRSPDRQLEGKDEFNYWFMQAAGAFPSLLGNVWTGFDMIFDGHVFRGVETASPKFVKDLMRAGRFAYEGATTMRGDKLVEEFTAKEIITQALGFTPAVVAEQYERNSALMNAQQRIRDERSQLMKGLIDANQNGNEAKAEELIGKIQAFNEENPEVPITFDSLRRSAESRARYSGRAEGGVALDRRLDARLRDSIGDAIYK